MMPYVVALVLVTLAVAPAPAQTVTAKGARTCAGWNEHRVWEREGHPHSAHIYQTWLVGYLSGVAAGMGVDLLAGTRNDPLFLLVDRYCGENPAANLAQAGGAVAEELLRQRSVVYWGTR